MNLRLTVCIACSYLPCASLAGKDLSGYLCSHGRQSAVTRQPSSLPPSSIKSSRLSAAASTPCILMPSLFSRSRTTSTPKKSPLEGLPDEFGRVDSRGSSRALTPVPQGSARRDRKKDKERARKLDEDAGQDEDPEYAIPDGSFLSLSLDPPPFVTSDGALPDPHPLVDYGYLSYGRHVILGLEQAARLVDVVGNELGTRGLTTPFIFSTLALDVSSAAVKRLIQAFLKTCTKPSAEADRQWREEAQFAGPHELGMCLRWGLARVVRIVRGQGVRGLLSYDTYAQWRDEEAGACPVLSWAYSL